MILVNRAGATSVAVGAGPLSGASDAVRIDDVSVTYGRVVALDRISLTIPRGTSVALVGPNGSGKSTLLGVLAALVRPDAGAVENDLDGVALVRQHADRRTWMPLTAGEVVRMGRYPERGLLRRLRAHDRERVARAARRLESTDLLGRQLGELSGGQRQRVLIARALAQDPELLLLDEPVTGLDLASRQRILDLVDELRASGTTVVQSTHHLEDVEGCDQVVLLANRVVAVGPPAEVLRPEHLAEVYEDRLVRMPGVGGAAATAAVLDHHDDCDTEAADPARRP
jgi:zinc/manganese transport system ATP-binding protein